MTVVPPHYGVVELLIRAFPESADHRREEGFLAGEVIEKSALGNPGFGGNAFERDLGDAADQQQLLQCVENSIASVGSHVM